MAKIDRDRMKGLLAEAVTALCNDGLPYRTTFTVEGLLGITMDENEIFLVSIHEQMKNAQMDDSCDKPAEDCNMNTSVAGTNSVLTSSSNIGETQKENIHATCKTETREADKNVHQPVIQNSFSLEDNASILGHIKTVDPGMLQSANREQFQSSPIKFFSRTTNMAKIDRDRMKGLLAEAVTALCKDGLPYRTTFTVEGLLGITMDENEIFLVNIHEQMKNAQMDDSCDKPAEDCNMNTSVAGANSVLTSPSNVGETQKENIHFTCKTETREADKNVHQPVIQNSFSLVDNASILGHIETVDPSLLQSANREQFQSTPIKDNSKCHEQSGTLCEQVKVDSIVMEQLPHGLNTSGKTGNHSIVSDDGSDQMADLPYVVCNDDDDTSNDDESETQSQSFPEKNQSTSWSLYQDATSTDGNNTHHLSSESASMHSEMVQQKPYEVVPHHVPTAAMPSSSSGHVGQVPTAGVYGVDVVNMGSNEGLYRVQQPHMEGHPPVGQSATMTTGWGIDPRQITSVPATYSPSAAQGSVVSAPFTCGFSGCKKMFLTSMDLRAHVTIHSGDVPYLRTDCGKSFAERHQVVEHMQTHTDYTDQVMEKQYICERCNTCFPGLDLMRDHICHSRTGKQYPCEYCGMTFSQIQNLKHHKMTHTGEKPFVCTTCGRAFARKDTMKEHIISQHSGQRPFTCNRCGKGFMRKKKLFEHQLSGSCTSAPHGSYRKSMQLAEHL